MVFAEGVIEDFDACYRACCSRDARFDGWFFVAVTSTKIYCRPSCPAMTPKPEHLRFYPTAAAAQQAGFRACRRCRPDASPGSPEWDVRADVVARAMRGIADGVVDREGVAGLASRLGYGIRHLQRLVQAELGVGPLAIARAQRAQTARVLIETTDLGFAEVAFAAGFSSIRQFNDTIRQVFALTPTQMRGRRRRADASYGGLGPAASPTQTIRVRLSHRLPYTADGVLAHLALTAVAGVESFDLEAMTYRRTLRLPRGAGVAAVTPRPDHLECVLRLDDLRDLPAAVARMRWLFDLDADPAAIDAALSLDPVLAPLVARQGGRRVPRTPDGAELAVRAVLGQQVSTAAAARQTARLVEALGDPLAHPDGPLTHLFPTPAAIAEGAGELLRGPARRSMTVRTLAHQLAEGDLVLEPDADRSATVARLEAIAGVGPWTSATVAMRALGDPDAFVVDDLGVRAAAAQLGLPTPRRALLDRSAAWSPWRAYATQYLWGSLDHPVADLSHHANLRRTS